MENRRIFASEILIIFFEKEDETRYRKFRATLRTFLLRFAKEEQVNSSDFSHKIPINKEGGIEFFDIKFKFLPERGKYVIFTGQFPKL